MTEVSLRSSSYDLRGNYILSLNKPRTTSHGLSSSSYLSDTLWNTLLDFILATEFIGFKRESRAAFCKAAFRFNDISFNIMYLVMYLYMLCI